MPQDQSPMVQPFHCTLVAISMVSLAAAPHNVFLGAISNGRTPCTHGELAEKMDMTGAEGFFFTAGTVASALR